MASPKQEVVEDYATLPEPSKHMVDIWFRKVSEEVQAKQLGMFAIIAAVFFNVCGGPWGSEEIFKNGPLIGISQILIMALCFSLPQIQLTSELSCAFPVNGGYSIWVTKAFGPFWGFQESYWSWMSGVVDNAVYPVLIYDSLANYFMVLQDLSFYQSYSLKLLICFLVILPNIVSTHGTGNFLQIIGVLQLLPFLLFIVLAIPQSDPWVLTEHTSMGDISITESLMVVYWNLSGFDCISTVSGEICKPEKVLYKALLICLALAVGLYLVVLGVAACAQAVPWNEWQDGSLPHIVQLTCGNWIGGVLVVASCIGNSGMFIAELMEDSYQLEGMASTDVIPRWTRFDWKHPWFGTPWVAMMPSVAFVLLCVSFNFHEILMIDNCFNSLSFLLEIIAFYQLRRSRPDMERPYKMPAFSVYCTLPIAFFIGALVVVKSFKSWKASTINVIMLLAGFPVGFHLSRRFNNLYGKSESAQFLLKCET